MKAKVMLLSLILIVTLPESAQPQNDYYVKKISDAEAEYGVQITNTGFRKWFTDWSPDGKWITYSEFEIKHFVDGNVYIVPAEGGTPVNLTANVDPNNCYFPCFKPNSIEITFTGLPVGTCTINIETLEYSVIKKATFNAFWSHNGRYLVFPSGNNLSILDTNDGTVSDIATGNWWTTSCFTPDDLYVISTDGNDNKLYKIPVGGGTKERITFHEGMHWYPKCSPDGKWVVYTVWPKEFWADASLYATNLETGETFRIFPGLTDQHYSGSFSPDGSKLCYLKEIPDPDKQGEYAIYEVFVADVNLQGDITTVSSNDPNAFLLSTNYPNPFNPKTTINYQLDQPGMVNLVIYDLLGRKVATLVDETKTPGNYTVTWNAEGFASGVYFYRIELGDSKVLTQKMMLMR